MNYTNVINDKTQQYTKPQTTAAVAGISTGTQGTAAKTTASGMTSAGGSGITAGQSKGYPMRKQPAYDPETGGYAVRQSLENAGITDIGWDGKNVTAGGLLFTPEVNRDGVTFAQSKDINNFINRVYEALGDKRVQANKTDNGYGMTGLLGWNDATREMTVDGKPFEYTYIDDDGNAWVSEKELQAAYDEAARARGIVKAEDLLADYDREREDSYDRRRGIAREARDWKMSAEDMEKDAAYQAYKQLYEREADRAYKNALGQVSARTGGALSSVAQSAAAQAQQYYLSQLQDRIPQLQEMAYNRFLEGAKLDYDTEQQRAQDALYRYDAGYTANRDRISDERTAMQDQYDRMSNDLKLKDSTEDYNQKIRENALSRALTLGYWTPEDARIYGAEEGSSPYAGEIKYQSDLWDQVGKREEQDKSDIQLDAEKQLKELDHKNNLEVIGLQNQNDAYLKELAYGLESKLMDKEYGLKNDYAGVQNKYDLEKMEKEYRLKALADYIGTGYASQEEMNEFLGLYSELYPSDEYDLEDTTQTAPDVKTEKEAGLLTTALEFVKKHIFN